MKPPPGWLSIPEFWNRFFWGDETLYQWPSIPAFHYPRSPRLSPDALTFTLVRNQGHILLRYTGGSGSDTFRGYLEIEELPQLQQLMTEAREQTQIALDHPPAPETSATSPDLSKITDLLKFTLTQLYETLIVALSGAALVMGFGARGAAVWLIAIISGIIGGGLIEIYLKQASPSARLASALAMLAAGIGLGFYGPPLIPSVESYLTPLLAAGNIPVGAGIAILSVNIPGAIRKIRYRHPRPWPPDWIEGISDGGVIGFVLAAFLGWIPGLQNIPGIWMVAGLAIAGDLISDGWQWHHHTSPNEGVR